MMTLTQHEEFFTISSTYGPIMSCPCGWYFPLEDITMSPLHPDPAHKFFRAGVDAGKAFTRHALLEQGIEKARGK